MIGSVETGPDPSYLIEPFLSHPFEQWAYVLRRPEGSEAIVVDPGFQTRPLLAFLRDEGLRPAAILNTHGHSDHIAGNAALKSAFPDAPILIGRRDAHLLLDPEANLSAPFGKPFTSPPADRLLDDGDRLELAGFCFDILEIPGHSPGSIALSSIDETPPFVLAGDILFAGSVGRCDFPGGDMAQLVLGIRSKLLPLPDATLVYPGHGPPTTIGDERVRNPYVGEGGESAWLD